MVVCDLHVMRCLAQTACDRESDRQQLSIIMSCTFLNHNQFSLIVLLLIIDTGAQIMFTLHLEIVHNLPLPAKIFVMIGDILVDGEVVDGFREIRTDVIASPTREKIMKTGTQLQAEIWPLLWKNIVVEKK